MYGTTFVGEDVGCSGSLQVGAECLVRLAFASNPFTVAHVKPSKRHHSTQNQNRRLWLHGNTVSHTRRRKNLQGIFFKFDVWCKIDHIITKFLKIIKKIFPITDTLPYLISPGSNHQPVSQKTFSRNLPWSMEWIPLQPTEAVSMPKPLYLGWCFWLCSRIWDRWWFRGWWWAGEHRVCPERNGIFHSVSCCQQRV